MAKKKKAVKSAVKKQKPAKQRKLSKAAKPAKPKKAKTGKHYVKKVLFTKKLPGKKLPAASLELDKKLNPCIVCGGEGKFRCQSCGRLFCIDHFDMCMNVCYECKQDIRESHTE